MLPDGLHLAAEIEDTGHSPLPFIEDGRSLRVGERLLAGRHKQRSVLHHLTSLLRDDSIRDVDGNELCLGTGLPRVRESGWRNLISIRVFLQLLIWLSVDHEITDLEVPVNDVTNVKIVIIVAERIYEILGHFEPTKIEDKLQCGEEGEVEVVNVGVVAHEVDSAGYGPVEAHGDVLAGLHHVHLHKEHSRKN